ncbi:flagellin [Paenibacillus intestini]|nr:flagellin [Paenibacillus intestini]
MRIASNIVGLDTLNKLKINNKAKEKDMEKLSSGLKINRAGDDAAGLTISEKMRGQIRGLEQASRNVQDGLSLINTAEGGLQEITEIIQRQRELIIQGSNDTYTESDRKKIDQEISKLTDEINSLANRTDFNTTNLLARSDFQVLKDRSSHNVDISNVGPLPKTTDRQRYLGFLPIGTNDEPLNVKSSTTKTEINDTYNQQAQTTPIASQDGRQGYNDYEKKEHVHTETTSTKEYLFARELYTDTAYKDRYKQLDIRDSTERNILFQTNLIPNVQTVGILPNFGRFSDDSISIEIDGSLTTLANINIKSSTKELGKISVLYEKDGFEIEKVITTDGSSFKAEFKVRNNSGDDHRTINIRTAFSAGHSAHYTLSSSSGIPIGGTASGAQIPNTGTAFEISNSLVDFNLSFLSDGANTKPSSLTTPSTRFGVDGSVITSTWENNDISDGEVLEFGISLDNFNFKQDIYLFTEQHTNQIDSIIETTTTDIKDIDYIPPNVSIQTGANENQSVKIPLFKLDADGLGLANVGLLPPAIPEQSIASTDNALNKVSSYRGLYGALQNRMEHTLTNVGNSLGNLASSESRIRDADMAVEMMKFSQKNILTQAAQAMLIQANLEPQGVLQLLK